MKQKVLNILGENNTTPAQFNKETLETYAVYTYRGDVFCLGGPGKHGTDFPFDDISPKGQSDIVNELNSKNFVFNAAFQG